MLNKAVNTLSIKPPKLRRVCVLTGGGDAPGLNAVLRAFVKTADSLGIETWGSQNAFDGLIQGDRLVLLTPDSVRGILHLGGSILGCSNRGNPFKYPTEDNQGRILTPDVSGRVLSCIKDKHFDALVLIGGDGTMAIGQSMMDLGVPIIGIPKTIDNDLAATDVTFGFDTAVGTATWALDKLHSTAEAHDRVLVVELMGRHAGWLALCAGIAGGADVVAIPELPYDIERVVEKIEMRARHGRKFSLVVVGEGAYPKGGTHSSIKDASPGLVERLAGAGKVMAEQLGSRISHEVRVTVLGHLQRGGSPSPFDRILATRFGAAAAHLCAEGTVGKMVTLRGQNIVPVPIAEALQAPHAVDLEGELVGAARDVGIELGG